VSAILLLGFLLGMRHALEADHIAAVVTLAARNRSARQTVWQGAVWGFGHTIALFLVCSAVLFLDSAVPARVAGGLEAAVGIMLVALGMDLLYRLRRERVHFHAHRHSDGTVHSHAHSHKGEDGAHRLHHDHEHPRRFPMRALCVGLMHGLAGSAALILLTLGTVASPLTGLAYVALFGLGSIGGMALLSMAIGVPLRGARRYTRVYSALQTAVGLTTIGIGAMLTWQHFLAG
jgi:ABC-type nickel/cobalt efflux system permease component RcnA